MATLLPIAEQQFCDSSGAPLVGGLVYFYVPGTTTPKDTYQDAGEVTKNQNPVVLDAAGRAVIFGVGSYRQVLKDAAGEVVFDQVTADTSSAGASWAGTATGSANIITLSAPSFSSVDGQAIDFLAGFTNTGAVYALINGTPIPVKLDTVAGPVTSPAGAVTAGNRYRVTYDATAGLLHLTPVVDRGYVDAGLAAAEAYGAAQASSALTQAEAYAAAQASSALTQAVNNASAQASSALSQAESYAANADAVVASNAAAGAASALSQAETFTTNADATVTANCNAAAQGYASAAKTAAETYSDSQLAAAQSANASTYVQGVRLSGVFTPGLPYNRSNGQVVAYVNFSPNSVQVGNIQYNLNGTWVNVSG